MKILSTQAMLMLESGMMSSELKHAVKQRVDAMMQEALLDEAIYENDTLLYKEEVKAQKAMIESLVSRFESHKVLFETMSGFEFNKGVILSQLDKPTIKLFGLLISWSQTIDNKKKDLDILKLKHALLDTEKQACMKSRRVSLQDTLNKLNFC